jgi:hypothetical protein
MNPIVTMKENTGFPANINNFKTTTDDYRYFENSSDKLTGIEIIKNEFFIVEEQQEQLEVSAQSFSTIFK